MEFEDIVLSSDPAWLSEVHEFLPDPAAEIEALHEDDLAAAELHGHNEPQAPGLCPDVQRLSFWLPEMVDRPPAAAWNLYRVLASVVRVYASVAFEFLRHCLTLRDHLVLGSTPPVDNLRLEIHRRSVVHIQHFVGVGLMINGGFVFRILLA